MDLIPDTNDDGDIFIRNAVPVLETRDWIAHGYVANVNGVRESDPVLNFRRARTGEHIDWSP